MQRKKQLPKWLKWEFWPYWFFYIPIYFLILFQAIRLRSLSWFTLANPGMRTGGFSSYSKYEILNQLRRRSLPAGVLFRSKPQKREVLEAMEKMNIAYPVIMKPDEGERGWKVEKINNEADLNQYLSDAPHAVILQEYIADPEEYGIMYFRYPGEKGGNISSMMKRDFLTVTGDGKSTLLELMMNHERCIYHLPRMRKKFNSELETVIKAGAKIVLEEIGNHNRGTTFFDAQHLISAELVKVFDELSSTLHEWYFGRFDVRTPSIEELLKGNLKVIEVNGTNSEPAHIYDPHMNIFNAYRDLFAHWNVMFRISRANRRRGFKPEKSVEVLNLIREHLAEKRIHPNKI